MDTHSIGLHHIQGRRCCMVKTFILGTGRKCKCYLVFPQVQFVNWNEDEARSHLTSRLRNFRISEVDTYRCYFEKPISSTKKCVSFEYHSSMK